MGFSGEHELHGQPTLLAVPKRASENGETDEVRPQRTFAKDRREEAGVKIVAIVAHHRGSLATAPAPFVAFSLQEQAEASARPNRDSRRTVSSGQPRPLESGFQRPSPCAVAMANDNVELKTVVRHSHGVSRIPGAGFAARSTRLAKIRKSHPPRSDRIFCPTSAIPVVADPFTQDRKASSDCVTECSRAIVQSFHARSVQPALIRRHTCMMSAPTRRISISSNSGAKES